MSALNYLRSTPLRALPAELLASAPMRPGSAMRMRGVLGALQASLDRSSAAGTAPPTMEAVLAAELRRSKRASDTDRSTWSRLVAGQLGDDWVDPQRPELGRLVETARGVGVERERLAAQLREAASPSKGPEAFPLAPASSMAPEFRLSRPASPYARAVGMRFVGALEKLAAENPFAPGHLPTNWARHPDLASMSTSDDALQSVRSQWASGRMGEALDDEGRSLIGRFRAIGGALAAKDALGIGQRADKQRRVTELALKGMSPAEIAKRLGNSPNSASVLIAKSRDAGVNVPYRKAGNTRPAAIAAESARRKARGSSGGSGS